jgi:hypothetical protein
VCIGDRRSCGPGELVAGSSGAPLIAAMMCAFRQRQYDADQASRHTSLHSSPPRCAAREPFSLGSRAEGRTMYRWYRDDPRGWYRLAASSGRSRPGRTAVRRPPVGEHLRRDIDTTAHQQPPPEHQQRFGSCANAGLGQGANEVFGGRNSADATLVVAESGTQGLDGGTYKSRQSEMVAYSWPVTASE